MANIKRSPRTAHIECDITLRDTLPIERKPSLPIPLQWSQSVERDARIARAVYIRDLITRVVKVLAGRGIEELTEQRPVRSVGRKPVLSKST